MGFLSKSCHGCGHSIVAMDKEVPPHAQWMKRAVAITPDGTVHRGTHDGYGSLGEPSQMTWDGKGGLEGYTAHTERMQAAGRPLAYGSKATVYHEACHAAAADPRHPNKYLGPSADAADQGWFGKFDQHPPGHPKGVIVRNNSRGAPQQEKPDYSGYI